VGVGGGDTPGREASRIWGEDEGGSREWAAAAAIHPEGNPLAFGARVRPVRVGVEKRASAARHPR
jgi:hypothetical protein